MFLELVWSYRYPFVVVLLPSHLRSYLSNMHNFPLISRNNSFTWFLNGEWGHYPCVGSKMVKFPVLLQRIIETYSLAKIDFSQANLRFVVPSLWTTYQRDMSKIILDFMRKGATNNDDGNVLPSRRLKPTRHFKVACKDNRIHFLKNYCRQLQKFG